MSKYRIKWIDIAKAVGIIAVVVGHALHPLRGDDHQLINTIYSSIYWWHMPLFFILSGFFLKPLERNFESFKHFIKKKVLPNIKDYFLYGIILVFLSHFLRSEEWSYTFKTLGKLVYGGRTLTDELTVFWFINVLIITTVVVTLLISYVKDVRVQFFISIMMFTLGVSYKEIGFFKFEYMPWSLDRVLLTTFWMLLGYYLFKYYPAIKHKGIILMSGLSLYALFFVLKYQGILVFGLYIKSHKLHNTFLIFYASVLFCLTVFILSDKLLSKIPIISGMLAFLGKFTIPIMYFHKAVFDLVDFMKLDSNQTLICIVFGLLLPLFAYFIIKKIMNQFKPIEV
ncbi:acyltransferase family protein [Lactobacillus sp. S2-2]|uniref:acyltransferase family protein n=1 Tax=Lactobacillus sp. S2-2 TaxID=2692917 RepID=UPI001F2E0713|nr:acyltransferase [Lactobacillus sp. S2-2]MCF6515747.1 acyltransferase family protein [Lactobacillus sp. S2-2]